MSLKPRESLRNVIKRRCQKALRGEAATVAVGLQVGHNCHGDGTCAEAEPRSLPAGTCRTPAGKGHASAKRWLVPKRVTAMDGETVHAQTDGSTHTTFVAYPRLSARA